MSHSLASYFTRYVQNAEGVARSLNGPVLLYEPASANDENESTSRRFRFKTVSGVEERMIPGEPRVFLIHKYKDNAFPRGVTIGRTSNNDLVLEDASVSRFHAWFQRDPQGQWHLADAASKNGTLIGEERLVPKKLHRLAGNARLQFGNVMVTFMLREQFLLKLEKIARGPE